MSGPFRSFRPTRPVASAPARLHVETLESRTVPAIFNIADGDVAGLIAAITTANTNADTDTINLAANGTFTLAAVDNTTSGTNGLPVVLADGGNGLTINGNGAVIQRSAAAPNMRILEVNNSGSLLSISGVTIRGGSNPGSDGGGIRVDANAALSLSDSTVTANAITTSNRGGGIAALSGSTLAITNSVISGNSTAGKGGGISVYGTAVTPATLSMQNSQITGNTAGNRGGGAFLYNSTTVIQNATVSGNTATNRGGGLHLYKGTATVLNSTISGNTAGSRGGGAELYKCTATLQNCTIEGNTAANRGGGLFLYKGTTTVANTTISGNTATGVSGFGGGVMLYRGTHTLTNCTITGNTASQQGGGLFIQDATTVANVQNTIVAENTDISGANDIVRTGGTLNTSNNLIQNLPGGTINGTDASNITGVSPLLGPIQNNGGTTRTRAPLSGSPALGAGDPSFAGSLTTDQRGKTRTAGGQIDIGAVEAQPPAITSGNAVTFTPGSAGTFTVTTTGDLTIALSSVGALPSGVTFTDNGNGTATLAGTPTPSGRFILTITAANGVSPNASQSFTLTVLPRPVIVSATPGAGAGDSTVRVYDVLSGQTQTYTPFPGFGGNVSTATGDLTGDGVPDLVTAAGAGGGPHVKVFDGRTLAEVRSFFAYDPAFSGGVNVAAGDLDGDGRAEIVTGAGAGGAPHVRAFDGQTGAEEASFFAYDAAFAGGVFVATGDLDADGYDDIITGAGPGGGPHVKAFSGHTLNEFISFFATDPSFRGGVIVG